MSTVINADCYISTGLIERQNDWAKSAGFLKKHIASRLTAVATPIFNALDFVGQSFLTAGVFAGSIVKTTLRAVWLKKLAGKLPDNFSFSTAWSHAKKVAFFAAAFFAAPIVTLVKPKWNANWYIKQGVASEPVVESSKPPAKDAGGEKAVGLDDIGPVLDDSLTNPDVDDEDGSVGGIPDFIPMTIKEPTLNEKIEARFNSSSVPAEWSLMHIDFTHLSKADKKHLLKELKAAKSLLKKLKSDYNKEVPKAARIRSECGRKKARKLNAKEKVYITLKDSLDTLYKEVKKIKVTA